MLDYQQLLIKVKKWVREVGDLQLASLGNQQLIDTKSTQADLVTEVDKKSEEILINKIRKYYPEHSILAEEGGGSQEGSDYCWIIDPLDGTNNYAHGFPIFCISIALEQRGETVLGVVYVPTLEQLYWARRGEGAFLNGDRLQVAGQEELGRALLATGFPYDKDSDPQNNVDNFAQLITQVRGIRRSGSAAFDLSQVASGVYDGFWELKLKKWDLAAGALLVQEAGGKVLTFENEKGINIIAANQKMVKLLLAELNY
ncbi:inositol monophosphatase family protein [Fuchsiella alkaliacetigena]|uniref:inositol monophosphatase family protein n=1 Tax=Fuchsiella alkaliacetigena TaxID=957042 RepID=UPI00200B5121|nr:inositol monophosphatase family protein [Fuchsiella alkaliacetigena]MCK8825680.1 inositol monophosphatase [Fuchsiella alkaliacetigena]